MDHRFTKVAVARTTGWPSNALGHRIPRPLWWNSLVTGCGQALPALAHMLVLPALIHGLGLDRFAVFAVVWTLFSYLTLFDLGLSRGTARSVAQAHALGNERSLPRIVWTSGLLLVLMGAATGALLWLLAPIGVAWLRFASPVNEEALQTFRLAGAALPVFLGAWALQAVLEGLQRFAPLAVARAVSGAVTALALGVAARLGLGLPSLVGIMAISRTGYFLALAWILRRAIPGIRAGVQFDLRTASALLNFGRWVMLHAWMTPLLTYGDRFVIGVLKGPVDLSLYVVPQEVLLRLMMIPTTVMSAAYPLLSSEHATGDVDRVRKVFAESLRLAIMILGSLSLVLILFPREILHFWIGPQMVRAAAPLQIMAAGSLLLGSAYVCSIACTALGRPDLPARITLAIAAPYMALIVVLIKTGGVTGAAVGYALRGAVQLALYTWAFANLLRSQVQRLRGDG